jgi:hypothetical protein
MKHLSHLGTSLKMLPNYSQQDATFLDLSIFTDALHISGNVSRNVASFVGCNLESYYDARTYAYQILKMLFVFAFASVRKKQFTLIFVLSTTFQELH